MGSHARAARTHARPLTTPPHPHSFADRWVEELHGGVAPGTVLINESWTTVSLPELFTTLPMLSVRASCVCVCVCVCACACVCLSTYACVHKHVCEG
jgi:hypothetical protein